MRNIKRLWCQSDVTINNAGSWLLAQPSSIAKKINNIEDGSVDGMCWEKQAIGRTLTHLLAWESSRTSVNHFIQNCSSIQESIFIFCYLRFFQLRILSAWQNCWTSLSSVEPRNTKKKTVSRFFFSFRAVDKIFVWFKNSCLGWDYFLLLLNWTVFRNHFDISEHIRISPECERVWHNFYFLDFFFKCFWA